MSSEKLSSPLADPNSLGKLPSTLKKRLYRIRALSRPSLAYVET